MLEWQSHIALHREHALQQLERCILSKDELDELAEAALEHLSDAVNAFF